MKERLIAKFRDSCTQWYLLSNTSLHDVQLMKNETLKITYSYWDGQGHRRVAAVKKGDTVKDFLQKIKEQLIPEFRELRCVAPAAVAEQSLFASQPTLPFTRMRCSCAAKAEPSAERQ